MTWGQVVERAAREVCDYVATHGKISSNDILVSIIGSYDFEESEIDDAVAAIKKRAEEMWRERH